MLTTIAENIIASQKGNQLALMNLINKFYPVLKKHGNKLKYEDGYNDLVLYFIELVNKFNLSEINNVSDGGLVNYINNSIYHKYIALSRNWSNIGKKTFFIGDVLDTGFNSRIPQLQHNDLYSNLFFGELSSVLTSLELYVITLHYRDQFTIHEIALMKGVSRQAINKIKLNALKKLRKRYGVN